jgi:signal transduction histidine kinase
MSIALVLTLSILYLLLLFLVATLADTPKGSQSLWVNNPYTYALSLAVYCSAWTFYGSVGRAARGELDFLTIYLGPALMAVLFWSILRKMVRISKAQSITTLPDFISARYGKKIFIGNFVAILCTLGIIPYIALQIKALSASFSILTAREQGALRGFFYDPALYFTLALGLFTLLYASRKITSDEKNTGMIAAIAFEGFVKLIAFLAVGLGICLYAFPSFPALEKSMDALIQNNLQEEPHAYLNWLTTLVLSALAIFLLPRQFEVGVVENRQEQYIQKAMWLFPLYLLLINLFVLPIAAAGNAFLNQGMDPDYFVLGLPLYFENIPLAAFTYLGGFSASSSMIIVSTVALSRMLSNNFMIPIILKNAKTQQIFPNTQKIPAYTRRFNIVLVLVLAWLYHYFFSEKYSLVSIGLISFLAVAQFAPSLLGGMYWRKGNYKGAMAGMLVGFAIWAYVLILPSLIAADFIPDVFNQWPILGTEWLQPAHLLGLKGYSPLTLATLWSLSLNTLLYILVSLHTRTSTQEINQAEIFTKIFQYSSSIENSVAWKGKALLKEITSLLQRFMGPHQTQEAVRQFEYKHNLNLSEQAIADSRFVNYAENILSGVIGAGSARLMVNSVAQEDPITFQEVVEILKESQELIHLNKELTRTSLQLKKATQEVQKANLRLKYQDELKDEFLYTVTHELRTPLTSIKALSEILHEHEDMDPDLRQKYLQTIVNESERMTRLISQVLDLENFESGKHKLIVSKFNLSALVMEACETFAETLRKKKIDLQIDLQKLPEIYADRDRIMQVLVNLLSNAVKFCPQEEGKIIVSAYQLENNVKINVGDNGPGISAELSQTIFEKFFQARNQTILKPKGSGLGLAISKKIVGLHQGKIWVEPSRYGGARFSFTLPINLRDYD